MGGRVGVGLGVGGVCLNVYGCVCEDNNTYCSKNTCTRTCVLCVYFWWNIHEEKVKRGNMNWTFTWCWRKLFYAWIKIPVLPVLVGDQWRQKKEKRQLLLFIYYKVAVATTLLLTMKKTCFRLLSEVSIVSLNIAIYFISNCRLVHVSSTSRSCSRPGEEHKDPVSPMRWTQVCVCVCVCCHGGDGGGREGALYKDTDASM